MPNGRDGDLHTSMTTHALLFTDIIDSTRLVEHLGDGGAADIWDRHDRRARGLLAPHHGREIDRTDGFFLLFEHASAAVAYALAYHEMLVDLGMRARAGIHVGPVRLRRIPAEDVARGAKSLEVEGVAKPLAARVMSLAQGGQTLLTGSAHEALLVQPVEGADIERHGHYRFKGIESPVEIFEVGRRGAAPFAPPPDADKAYRVIELGGLWWPVREVPHNLPYERDGFVGRSAELRELAARLNAGARLLTMVGTGGAGKTRLARRYGWTWIGDWPGGVYFCDLSECRTLDGIWFAIASALEVPLGRGNPAVLLGHAIAGRGRSLLILDNFEQVIEHAGATVGQLLDRTSDASFLVTSRERLHLNGETLFTLESLPLETDSIELFRLRATAQRPNFELTHVTREPVTEIVRMLDGLPLAIELAAARIGVLSPVQLLERLKDRFRVLAGARGNASRQATLRNAIDWSWGLLTVSERAALAQCSVFEGGFTLAAAESVLDLGESGRSQVLDVIQALVDKSLLRTLEPINGSRYDLEEPYFGMYVSIREYAREKLHDEGSELESAVVERHGNYFATFGADDEIEALSRHGGGARRRALAQEIDNLVTACRWALENKRVGPAVATYRATWEVLELQGPVSLASTLGREVLALPGLSDRLLLVALATVALPLQRAGRMEEAKAVLERSLELSSRLSERGLRGRILGQLGTLHLDQGQIEQARLDLEDALMQHREVADRRAEGATLSNLGNFYFGQGLMAEARLHYEAALAINSEIGNRRLEGVVLSNLGLLHSEQGRVAEALEHYEAALTIHREVGSRRLEGTVLGNLGLLRFGQSELDKAKAQDEAALIIHRMVGNRRDEAIVLGNLGEVHFAQRSLLDAHDCYRAAIAIAREVGNLQTQGGVLGSLGELLAAQSRLGGAREALREGDAILRQVGDQLGLGKLLCTRGRVELADGKEEAARSALAEAEALAASIGAGPNSELGTEIGKLRKSLQAD
jgi:predicted ATPase/class 3 adenylate cyclase/Tfp pilus assembly protein PilF